MRLQEPAFGRRLRMPLAALVACVSLGAALISGVAAASESPLRRGVHEKPSQQAPTSTPTPTPTPVSGAVGRDGNSAAAVITMPQIEHQASFWVVLAVVAALATALTTRRLRIPHGGEITVVATVLPLAVGGIRGAVDPIITLMAVLFGVALLIILMRVQR